MTDSEWQIFILFPFSLCIMNRQHQFPLNDLRRGKRNGTWQAKDILNQEWVFAQVCIISKKSTCSTLCQSLLSRIFYLNRNSHQPWLPLCIHNTKAHWKGLGHAHGKNPCKQCGLLLAGEPPLFWTRCTGLTKQVISALSKSERPVSIRERRSDALGPGLTRTAIQTVSKQKMIQSDV